MKRDLVPSKIFVSFFGVGYLPVLPGTSASFVGILLYLLVFESFFLHLVLVLVFFGLGLLASHRVLQSTEERDPTWIVMDEIVGMLLALFWVPPKIPFLILGFVLFRFFDSVKVFPIDRLERMRGEWGIFLDDIGAGIYTNLILQLILRVTS